jgi:hypothetical protein
MPGRSSAALLDQRRTIGKAEVEIFVLIGFLACRTNFHQVLQWGPRNLIPNNLDSVINTFSMFRGLFSR